MKVLFVCHRVPFPPKRGGKIRPFNIIRHLHEQGHEVTVASLARSQAEVDEVAAWLAGKGIAPAFETPRHRPEFSAGGDSTYYQVMFETPDRLLIEVVYTGPKQ